MRAAREEPEDDAEQRPSAPIQQVGVVEVHVDDGRQLTASQGAGEVAQRVRRGNRPERPSRRELDDGRCREGRPALSGREVRRAAGLGACSRRSRARRRPPPPRRRCTSRPRRRASASSRVRAGLAPPPARELPSQRSWGGRGRGPSSACGARAGHVTPHPWPARTHARSSSPASASAGRTSAAMAKPPGRSSCSAAKRAHTASSRGRSTWQDTTAYRSRDVAPIVREVSSPA